MYIVWSVMIFAGFLIWTSHCCVLKSGKRCRFPDHSLSFGGRIVFDTPTGIPHGLKTEDDAHIVIIQQPRFKVGSFPVPFRGSGVGKFWKVPESSPATFCKAPLTTDAECIMPPGPPQNVRIDDNRRTTSGIQIVWEPPTVTHLKIFKYEIQYRAIERPYDSNFIGEDVQEIKVQVDNLQKSEYFLGDLDPSTMYEVHISACTILYKGASASVTGNTQVTRDLEPVDIDGLPLERSEGHCVTIYLPPLTQEFATGYIIQVVQVRRRGKPTDEKYTTAFINKTDETIKFTVGDGDTYGDYINRPLVEDQNYEVYIGVVSTIGDDIYIEWSDPIFIEAFVKKPFPVTSVIITCLIIMACILVITAVMIFRRRVRDLKDRKRNQLGDRRNLALPEIPQDFERYKLFTASTKNGQSELLIPTFDPYGVDVAPDRDEIRRNHTQTATSGFDISKGIDIARIQNRRLPAKPPPISTDSIATHGTYVRPQTHQVLNKTETEGTTQQLYLTENEKIRGGWRHSLEGKGHSENLNDFEKWQQTTQECKENEKRNGMVMLKSFKLPWKRQKSVTDFGDEYDDTDTVTDKKDKKQSKQNGLAMSKIERFSSKKETFHPDFGDTYDDTDVDVVTGGKKGNALLSNDNECRYSITRAGKSHTSVKYADTIDEPEGNKATLDNFLARPDFGDTYDDTDVDSVTGGKKNDALLSRDNECRYSITRAGKSHTVVKYADTIDKLEGNKATLGNLLARPDFGDTYDDTDVDSVTGGKKHNALLSRDNECRYPVTREEKNHTSVKYDDTIDKRESNTVAHGNVLDCPDFGDTYDDTDVDSVTGGKKNNALLSRDNECRECIPHAEEDHTSVIYEDAINNQENNAVAPDNFISDIYEENEVSSEDDVYEETEQTAVDRKNILSQPKKLSHNISKLQNQKDEQKRKKAAKKWFPWKRKDASVTENLGKENTKTIPTAEVSPIERNQVNYSGHLYPPSSAQRPQQTGTFLNTKTGKQVDVEEYNDIYEDTLQIEKKESTAGLAVHSRPPSIPPRDDIREIVQKWKGTGGANNTHVPVHHQGNRELGDVKDYGDEYDETAVYKSDHSLKENGELGGIKDYGGEYEIAVDSKSDRQAAAFAPVLPPKPVQVVTPSVGVTQKETVKECHGNARDVSDEELYEDTGGGEKYDDTCSLDQSDELYEYI